MIPCLLLRFIIMNNMFKRLIKWIKLRIYEILYIVLLTILSSYILINWKTINIPYLANRTVLWQKNVTNIQHNFRGFHITFFWDVTRLRVTKFEKITKPMFSQIVGNLNENKVLASLRDSLLPKFMSGELDVSELDL